VPSCTPSSNLALDTERLASAGILGDYIAPITWCGLKFAIDIDGNTNAWSNFFTRLLMGCCVLKVASAAGYRQWYYGDIEPWIHYVPVKADLSDICERIAWCRSNHAGARRIAAAGQEFATARDFDNEIAAAARRVGAAYQDRPPAASAS
jgi:Glycosyl transferase family 90